jgi:hypothetical protein
MMPAQPRLAREEVDVLADPAQVRVVVLRDDADAERLAVQLDRRKGLQIVGG